MMVPISFILFFHMLYIYFIHFYNLLFDFGIIKKNETRGINVNNIVTDLDAF